MSKGKLIKNLRESNGISQVELADLIGVSKQTLYKYENDIVTNIPSDKIEAIASALNTEPWVIMGWNKPSTAVILSSDESALLGDYRKLNDDGKAALRNTAAGLVASGAYTPLPGRK